MSGRLAHAGLLLADAALGALWDATINVDLSYSNGGRTVVGTAAGARTTRVPAAIDSSAKIYFEFVVAPIVAGSDPPQIGVCNKSSLPASLTGDAGSWCYLLSRGWTWAPTAGYATGLPTFAAGDRGMVAIDRAANKIWYGKAGSWIGGGSPAAGTSAAASNLSGALRISGSANNASGITLCCAPAEWLYAAPAGFSPPDASIPIADPDFSSVSLLLPMDGADDGSVFTDISANGHAVAVQGTPVTKTDVKRFGSASVRIPADLSCLKVPHHASLDMGGGDFTLEVWVHPTSMGFGNVLLVKNAGTGVYPWQLSISADSRIQFAGFGAPGVSLYFNLTSDTVLSVGNWYFVQARRSASTFALAVNGVEEDSASPGTAALYSNAAHTVNIGNYESGSARPAIGYLDDVRITKGVARDFVLPSAAFPDH